MTNNTILSVEHLRKVFKSGDQTLAVLSDVSFAIEEGSACAIVGPSGSGKTTLIAICAGLERPSEGAVVFNGVAIHGSNEKELAQIRNRFIGFIFQSFQLLPSLTALENVMVPAEIRGENHARSRAADLLQRVGLGGRLQSLSYPAFRRRTAAGRHRARFHEPTQNSLCRRAHRKSRCGNRQGYRAADF